MPAWAWTGIMAAIQAVIVGLWSALRMADQRSRLDDQRRMAKIEQWVEDNKKAFDLFKHTEYTPKLESLSKDLWQTMARHVELNARVDGIHEWKHAVGDAYLPRAVDDHERRLNRLDSKVFNGGPK